MIIMSAHAHVQPQAPTQAISNATSAKRERKEVHLSKDQIIKIVGSIASIMSVIMYVSYIPQIAANLAGNPGVFWQPLAAFVNCVFWTVYGFGCKPKQWPIIIANVPGIFLAAATVVTCFVH